MGPGGVFWALRVRFERDGTLARGTGGSPNRHPDEGEGGRGGSARRMRRGWAAFGQCGFRKGGTGVGLAARVRQGRRVASAGGTGESISGVLACQRHRGDAVEVRDSQWAQGRARISHRGAEPGHRAGPVVTGWGGSDRAWPRGAGPDRIGPGLAGSSLAGSDRGPDPPCQRGSRAEAGCGVGAGGTTSRATGCSSTTSATSATLATFWISGVLPADL